nr:RNA-directed DNA polymerase, eukaryota, reverse transcriptase zinc-binding domain protein [Tanacetum cinerariifolium]
MEGVNDVQEGSPTSVNNGDTNRLSESKDQGKDIINTVNDGNVGWLRRKEKKEWVKQLCYTNGVNFLSIQETKMVTFDMFVVKAIWGNMLFDFATCLALGKVVVMGDFNEVSIREINHKKSIDLVQKAKIKWAIEGDCGSDKSPGPDGFTFEFFKKFWYLVRGDVINTVKEFFNSSSFPNGCNPSFIALNPKVLVANLLNEFCSISLIVMESIHAAFQRVTERGMFSPIIIGRDKAVSISQLFYTDDAMFIGKWSSSNVSVLVMVLYFFFLASGLKINVNKSSIYGLGVKDSDINLMADRFSHLTNKLPFTYLVVKVGANMTHISSWNEVVQKLEGLLNSFFLGADIDDRKMTWVCWKKVMAKKQYDGLGISSLFALNRALLFTWIWRFYSSHSGLWLDIVKAIYGSNGSLYQQSLNYTGCSVWIMVRKSIANLKSKHVDLMESRKKVIRNSYNTSFWHEKWFGEECFKVRFNRLFNLELHKDVSVEIYGSNGSLDQPSLNHTSCSVWIMVRKSIASLKSKHVDLMKFRKKVTGNGYNTSFWHEKWFGEECLKVRFNKLINLELHKDVLVGQNLQNSDCALSFHRRPRVGVEECQWLEFSQLLPCCFY